MEDNQVKHKIRIIGNFMAKNNINQNLRQQIRIYLEYYQRQFSEQNEKEEHKVISHLSENLKNSLMIEANKFILRESPIFSKYFSEGVIEKMVSIIKEYRSTPEQVIYQRNIDKEDPKIYFIKSGLVEIYASRTANKSSQVHLMQKTPVKVLKQGESFGEYQFFTGNSNTFSARSLEFSRILYISRRDFLDLLKQYPLDYEKFCYIKDKITFQRDASGINLKCYICDSQKHLVEKCTIPHYIEDIYKIVKKQQYSVPVQERQEFQRGIQKIPWHLKLDEVREHAWQLQDDNESYIENASWMSWDSDSYIPSDDENMINAFDEQNLNNNGLNNSFNNSFSQRLCRNNMINHDFENLVNERQQIDLQKDQKRHIRSLNHEQNNSSSHGDQMKTQKISNSMLASKHIQIIRKSQMLSKLKKKNQQSQIYQNETELSPAKTFEKKETLQSSKKKQQRQSSTQEQIFFSNQRVGSSNTTNPQNQYNENMYASQIKQFKQSGKHELNNFQNPEIIKSLQSDKQSIKLTRNQNANSNSPSNLKYNQNMLQSQMANGGSQINNKTGMLPQKVVTNLQNLTDQQFQQGSPGNNQTINIAEIIGNQLMMNNKNNYMGKVNEENTFDIKKIYEFYYKHNNYPNVLKKYNKPILRLIKVLQKNRLKKRKDLSIVKSNSKSLSLAHSNSIVLSGKKSSYIDKKEERESPKKSFFNKEQFSDTIISDSINQSLNQKTENKLPSSTYQLKVNKSDYHNLNTSNMPLTPTSPNMSYQTIKNGKSIIIPFNQYAAEKNFDDTSMASLLNNNKLATISAIEDFNINKPTQHTQYYDTAQNIQTQNDPFIQYSNKNNKDHISKQVQMYIQDLKQNEQNQLFISQAEQKYEANGFKIIFPDLQEQLDDDELENKDFKKQLLFKQRQSQFISLPNKEQKFDKNTNDVDSIIIPIQEKTQENIQTLLKIDQDKEILSSLDIKQIHDEQKRNTEEQLAINNNEFEGIFQIQKSLQQNNPENNKQFLKLNNNLLVTEMQYLKVDNHQNTDQNQKPKLKYDKLEKMQRQSISFKYDRTKKNYDRTTSIEKSIQQQLNQQNSLRKSDKSTSQLQIIGEEKNFSKQQPSFNYSQGKKLSIRRYSRAYNMALQKRPSQMQPSQVELNTLNVVNHKQQNNFNEKSNRSISSSSSSNKSQETSPAKKIYNLNSNAQAKNFNFEAE